MSESTFKSEFDRLQAEMRANNRVVRYSFILDMHGRMDIVWYPMSKQFTFSVDDGESVSNVALNEHEAKAVMQALAGEP